MELTREQIITMSKCGNNGVCSPCFRNIECQLKTEDAIIVRSLATALLAEIDKPKIWDGAPEKATTAVINYYEKDSTGCPFGKEYTRTLPKSRIDEIAWEAASHWEGGKEALEKAIKSAILQARKEWEEER